MKTLLISILGLSSSFAQMLFTFQNGTTRGLFEQREAGAVPVNTGFLDHRGLGISRDGRYAIFGAVVDGNQGGVVVPSTDVFEFDRTTGLSRPLINSTSTISSFENHVASGLSLDNQFVAVATELFLRFGIQSNSSGKILEVYHRASGQRVSDVTGPRGGAVDDGLGLEFSSISWSPRAPSFVTSYYVTVPGIGGLPTQLTAIVRFDRAQNGQWFPSQQLSSPSYFPSQFGASVIAQGFPSYSPSGTEIAFFSIHYPDALGSTQGAQASVVVMNADGSNPRTLTTFNPGFLPTGLTWSTDGTQLLVSIAPQQFNGVGFLHLAISTRSVIRRVSLADGSISQLPGIDGGELPQTAMNMPPPLDDLSGLTPSLFRSPQGDLILRATGLDPSRTYQLEQGSTPGTVSTTSQFSGAEFSTGIVIPTSATRRFFQIRSSR